VSPQRHQRLRTKGWRAPAGAVYVGRPTQWGNPYRLALPKDRWVSGRSHRGLVVVHVDRRGYADGQAWAGFETRDEALRFAVDLFERMIRAAQLRSPRSMDSYLRELVGRDLMCWCPPGSPCHGDVLLHLAAELDTAAAGEGGEP